MSGTGMQSGLGTASGCVPADRVWGHNRQRAATIQSALTAVVIRAAQRARTRGQVARSVGHKAEEAAVGAVVGRVPAAGGSQQNMHAFRFIMYVFLLHVLFCCFAQSSLLSSSGEEPGEEMKTSAAAGARVAGSSSCRDPGGH